MVGSTVYGTADRPRVPTLLGTSLTGKALNTLDARGSVVVINAWASWCGPCRDELPSLARSAASFAPSVQFIGLNERDTAAIASQFAAEVGIPYASISDPQGLLLASLRVVPPGAIPSTLILDKQGRVAFRCIGPVGSGELDAALREVLAKG